MNEDTKDSGKNNVNLNTSGVKDGKFLSDSGIVIVDDNKPKNESPRSNVGVSLNEDKKIEALAIDEKKDIPKKEIMVEEPLKNQENNIGEVEIENLEKVFKDELGSFEKDTEKKELKEDHIQELTLKLDSLHKKIEDVRSVKKEALEEELTEFKKLKEEIEGGLNKLKELENLTKKIDVEKQKINQVDTMEKEIEEDVKKIEEEINKPD